MEKFSGSTGVDRQTSLDKGGAEVRYLGRAVLGIVIALSSACLSDVPALASPAKGNAAAIALERSTIRAYTHVPGEKVVYEGGLWLKETSNGSWAMRAGEAWAPKGYQYVTDTTVSAMRDGRVLWESNTYTPACRPRLSSSAVGVCVEFGGTSLDLVFTRSWEYWRLVPYGSAPGCFYSFHPKAGYRPVGGTTWTLGGENFTSITRRGRMVIVAGTYKWGKYQTATETDTIFARSHLLSLDAVAVSKGKGIHEPAFTETDTYTNLRHTPSEPKVTGCG
ncbi:MAG: hypothetical protein ACYCST_16605 [Acidimicrobiales bacterium]